MLSVEDNELLTQVGPGTPMGALLRHYWWPVERSSEVGESDVVPVRLLGEDFVLFRTANGNLSLLDRRCAHRSMDLSAGEVVGGELVCPYHGWQYDTRGQCVAQPLEPAGSVFWKKIKIGSYPVQELAGLIFVYIGPEPAPLLPLFDRLVEPNTLRVIQYGLVACNWFQYVENSLDLAHPEILHGSAMIHAMTKQGVPPTDPRFETARMYTRHHTKIKAEPTEWGFVRHMLQEGDDEATSDNWTVGQPWYFPCVTMVASRNVHGAGYRVPIDDTTTNVLEVICFTPGEGVEVPEQREIPSQQIEYLDKDGKLSPFTVHAGDVAATLGQGTITDRSAEHLGQSDAGIIAMRRMFKEQVEKVARGEEPMNVLRDGDGVVRTRWAGSAYGRGVADDDTYQEGNAAAGMPVLFSDLMPEVDRLFAEAAQRRRERKLTTT